MKIYVSNRSKDITKMYTRLPADITLQKKEQRIIAKCVSVEIPNMESRIHNIHNNHARIVNWGIYISHFIIFVVANFASDSFLKYTSLWLNSVNAWVCVLHYHENTHTHSHAFGSSVAITQSRCAKISVATLCVGMCIIRSFTVCLVCMNCVSISSVSLESK